jgi:ribosomal protein S18 acetylase RimI-like enzyme
MDVGIREATAADYSGLCELFDEVDALHRDHLPHMFQKPNGPVREQDYYLGLIADEGVGFFVAEAGEDLVGFVIVAVRDAPTIPVLVPRRYGWVENIGVKSDSRGNGIGQMLMGTAHEWAIANGATAVEFNVHEFNQTAIRFYGRLGYQTLSRRMGRDLS